MMSKSTDTHNIQLTNLELNFTDGKKISYSDIIDGFVQKLKVAE